jgi:mannose-6-phosphate isomerase-like protein (cupin superfamily)
VRSFIAVGERDAGAMIGSLTIVLNAVRVLVEWHREGIFMIRSERVRMLLAGFFVLVGALGLRSSRPSAQARPAAEFPKSITVSSGPKTNLFPHLMTKADVLSALAQVKDSQDLVVKTNFAITLRAAGNTTRLPWKLHTEADELWFVYRGSAKVTLAPFSLQLGVTPPGNTYDAAEGHRECSAPWPIKSCRPVAEYVAVGSWSTHRCGRAVVPPPFRALRRPS